MCFWKGKWHFNPATLHFQFCSLGKVFDSRSDILQRQRRMQLDGLIKSQASEWGNSHYGLCHSLNDELLKKLGRGLVDFE